MSKNSALQFGGYQFIIPGVPRVQKQTRHRVVAGRTFCYDPSKKDKELIQKAIRPDAPETPLSSPVELTITFAMPIPKSTSKVQRNRMLAHMVLPDKRPDEDNLAYLVTNALKGIVYDDDSRICAKHVYKVYSDKPHTMIAVRPIFTFEQFGYPDAIDL